MDKLAEDVLTYCIREFEVESGSIFTKVPEEPLLRLVKSMGPRENYHCGESIGVGEGISGLAARRREPIHRAGELADSRLVRRKEEEQIAQFLSFPVMDGSEVLAVINLSGPKHGGFGRGDLQKCRAVSEKYANALTPVCNRGNLVFPESNLYSFSDGKGPQTKRHEPGLGLLACLPCCVLIFDKALQITHCNRQQEFENLFNTNGVSNIPIHLLKLPLEIEEEVFREKLEALRECGEAFRLKNVRILGAPCTRLVNMAFSPIRAADGGCDGGLVVVDDNTANFELQQKVVEAERLSLIGSMTSMITHEINGPLDGVMRLLKLSRINVKKGLAADEYLEQALKGLHHMSSLTKSLLGFSQTRAKPAPLNAVIESARDMCKYRNGECEIIWKFELRCGNPLVNENDFHQIFVNLFSNALDAIGSNAGCVRVKTSVNRHSVRIEIEDSGCGIPQAVRSRIFEAFWTTKEYGKGSGLGLTIVKKTVERHGGTIHVESGENAGAKFTLLFPRDKLTL
jgi:signal transduction histidine kinase